MTDAETLARALSLFNLALDHPRTERETWLRTQCVNQPVLLALVQKMLLADEQTQAALVTGGALPLDLAAQFAPPPEQISHYRIVELIGEGGMGQVYLADRADGVVEQQVAIKVLKRHLATDTLVRQFSRERQIMANLRHPTIANLLDAGTTEDGLPFVVMEYIDGLPLRDYLHQHNPELSERLKIFQDILAGVAHAHQNLIIHRDIKPGNVLVTNTGEPKLMDFGIARLLESDGDHAVVVDSPESTVGMLMTPSYASPEQIRGEALNTATDIYSLGLLLFECITGQPLIDVKGVSPLTAEKRINAVSDTLPSEQIRSTKPEIARQLRGDLDAVIGKAISNMAADRYPTVAAFAADLLAYAAGTPVVAQRSTFVYRSRKFIRRHRVAVSGAAVLAATVVGASLYSINQANIAERQRNIAKQESSTARDAVDFLKTMLFSVNPLTGEANAKTVDDVLAVMNDELETSFADRPATRVLLLASAAEVYLGRGDIDQALQYAQQSQALVASTGGLLPTDAAFAARVLAQVYLEQGKYPDAEREFLKSLALYETSEDKRWPEIASNYSDLGATLIGLSKESEAETAYRRSIQIHEGPDLNRPEAYATSLANLAGLHMDQGDYEAAEKLQVRAIDLFEQNASSPARRGMSLSNHAGTLWRLGRTDEAEAQYLNGIRYLEAAAGPEHPEVLIAKTSLGSLYLEQKAYDKGAPLMASTAEIADRTLDPDHQANSYSKNIAGQLLCETGETAAGLRFLKDAIAARIRSFGADHWAVASARSSLGNCLIAAGELAEAEVLLNSATQDLEKLRGKDHHMTVLAAERLVRAQTLRQAGD